MPLTEPRPHVSGLPRILPGFDDQAPGRWIFSIYGRRRCIATNAFPDWGIRGKVNAIPVFRDEAERFQTDPVTAFGIAGMISTGT